jgi:hypothetical protein
MTDNSLIMKNLLFALLFVLPIVCHAQSHTNIINHKKWVGDTVFWYKWKQKAINKLQLQQLANSSDVYHFRYWASNQLVEIWSFDGKGYNGFVVDYIETYNQDDWRKRKPTKLYAHSTAVDSAISRQVAQMLNRIRQVPIQDSITGWGNGNDGRTYIIELSTPNKYSFKEYWSPKSFAAIPEARQTVVFITELEELLGLKQKREQFEEALPAGVYTSGESWALHKRSNVIQKGYKLKSRKGPAIH